MARRPTLPLRGFSLVELLVTIVLAVLVFAALVPLFVDALSANTADSFRQIATSIAREKMEKIRQLTYDQIQANPSNQSPNQATPNLYDPTFLGGQFGPTEVSYSSAPHSITFHIDYTVTLQPVGSTPGTEAYKQVTVDVWWNGPPYPVKHAVLSTDVYKQHEGPRLNSLDVGGSFLQYDASSGTWKIDTRPNSNPSIPITAHVDLSNIQTTWKVTFSVVNNAGTEVFHQDVLHNWSSSSDPTNSGTYSVTWTPAAYVDGMCTFYAWGTSGTSAGIGAATGAPINQQYPLETGAPQAPTGLTATSQVASIKLTWTPSLASDIDHYTLYRQVDGGAWGTLADNLDPAYATAGYVDTDVSVGHTYVYELNATDDLDQTGPTCAPVSVTLVPQSDTTPPTAPSNVVATKVPNTRQVDLSWTASTDNVGVDHYNVYRSTNPAATWSSAWTLVGQSPVQVLPVFSDTSVANSTTYYYRIVAYDAAGNASNYGQSNPVTTDAAPPPPTYNITVKAVNNYSGGGQKTLVVQLYSGLRSGIHTLVGSVSANKGKSATQTWLVAAGQVYTMVTFNSVELPSYEQTWTHGTADTITVTYP
jgi:type II secretory pathway pseudopilin PulG